MSEESNSLVQVIMWLLFAAFLVFCVFGFLALMSGATFLFTIPFYFLFGWLTYPIRTLPLLNLQPSHAAIFLITLSLFVLGVHRLARWLQSWGALSFTPGSCETLWPWRRTLTLCALLMTFFGSGIAAIGTFHQTAWLANFKEPWVREMRGVLSNATNATVELVSKGDDQEWTNSEIHAAVSAENMRQDGKFKIIVAYDKNGKWCALISTVELDGKLRTDCVTRKFSPPFYPPRRGTLEELLESCARFTPPETAKPEAAR